MEHKCRNCESIYKCENFPETKEAHRRCPKCGSYTVEQLPVKKFLWKKYGIRHIKVTMLVGKDTDHLIICGRMSLTLDEWEGFKKVFSKDTSSNRSYEYIFEEDPNAMDLS